MVKILSSFSALLLVPVLVFSQHSLDFSAGISIDLNNNGRFKQLPLSAGWAPGGSKKGAFMLKADLGLALPNKSYDSAYTTSSSLPQAVSVQKNIKNTTFSVGIGRRFLIKTRSESSQFLIDFFPVGVAEQKFKVIYKNYNNKDYEIINPDVGLNLWGALVGLGIGYIRDNFIGRIYVQSPLIASLPNDYKLSYKLSAPLELTIGYIFKYSKAK